MRQEGILNVICVMHLITLVVHCGFANIGL